MKRSPMKAKYRKPMSVAERQEAAEWRRAAVEAGVCAICSRVWPLPAGHHVIYRQHCPTGRKWDLANMLPVCDLCHEAHHNGLRRIDRGDLTEANLQFANDVLGAGAGDYLRRRYR